MRLSAAKYQLRFIHPFGTAHGLRSGTDSVFVRLEHEGFSGFGEATMPPYLSDTQASVMAELERLDGHVVSRLLENGPTPVLDGCSMPCRAALTTAYYDLMSRMLNMSVSTMILDGMKLPKGAGSPMMTLGHTALADIPGKLDELKLAPVLKIKLGAANDKETLKTVLGHDQRPVFLDANQGWTSVSQARAIIELVDRDRLAGIEQPFAKGRLDLHSELRRLELGRIFADESIADPEDLEAGSAAFDGVNIKLMKCGGSDRAVAMIARARELGMDVMLGSMSESSLGCGAMAHFAFLADLVDLDGPWLIANDPFEGLTMEEAGMRINDREGLGITLKVQMLNWVYIGT